MVRRGRLSLRARLARIGFRLLMKKSERDLSFEQIRQRFARMEKMTPRPPRGTKTTTVNAGGVPGLMIETPASRPDRHMLYLHGGAYAFGTPQLYRHFTWRMADAARARVLIIDYRLAPEHPYPAGLEDAVTAWRWLIDHGAKPAGMTMAGDSAGGGLTLATMLKLRDAGAPLPAAAAVMSPWTDLALTAASFRDNAKSDPMLIADDVPRFAAAYLGGTDARDPYASPLYADVRGLASTLIQAGGDEILRDDGVRMAEKMRAAGCDVELQVWPWMPHTWHLLAPVLPEAREAIAEIARFFAQRLG
ncbi:MAG: alpha/beta hydrolase [Pseudolabrys sp.]